MRACDAYWDEALSYLGPGEFDTWLGQLGPSGRPLASQGPVPPCQTQRPQCSAGGVLAGGRCHPLAADPDCDA